MTKVTLRLQSVILASIDDPHDDTENDQEVVEVTQDRDHVRDKVDG